MTLRKQGFKTWYLAVFLCAFLACQLFPTFVIANDASAGTFGAPYLRIPVGATLMSVPDVVAGMEPDGSMAFSNPAMSAIIPHGHVFFSRAAWLDELSLNAASVVVPVPAYGIGLSLGSRLLHAGELRGYNDENEVVREERYWGLALSGALSKEFRPLGLSVGAGLNYLREHLPAEAGDGWSMCVGAAYVDGPLHASVFAQDLGGKISFGGQGYPLDSRYILGAGYALPMGAGRLDVGAQMVVSRSDVKRAQFGAVYHFAQFFVLRGGLGRAFDAPETSDLPMSAGFGLRYGTLRLDYAFAPQEYFANTHTFSIGWSFGTGVRFQDAAESGVLAGKNADPTLPVARENTDVGSTQAKTVAESAPASSFDPTGDGADTHRRSFAIVAGSHSRVESARSEARALQLVKVPAAVENSGALFTVVVGHYGTRRDAEKALIRYERMGHRFEIQPQTH